MRLKQSQTQLYAQHQCNMATTAIWNVKGWLGKVLIYVENPEKTDNPNSAVVKEENTHELEGLSDVLDYAMQDEKTLKKWDISHTETLQRFVSGVNCSPLTARTEMLAVKERFDKQGGNVAYHGYQSFAPTDNVTPETAHEIGEKLAQELWGDKFQVIVATHLDTANHIHNHFVLNSVSYLDGKKYNDCKATYRLMREASDRLCREYSLSVIPNPEKGHSVHYAQWRAVQTGQPTMLDRIKFDVDKAIAESVTDKQFFYLLRQQGYYIKRGKDITLRPRGKPHGRKLYRNFGENYSYENICRRILLNTPKKRKQTINPVRKQIHMLFRGTLTQKKKCTGLRALYYYYSYLFGFIGKKKTSSPRLKFIYREDIRKFKAITHEAELLIHHKIDTLEQLHAYETGLQSEITALTEERKHLRYRTKSKKGQRELPELKKQISMLTERLAALRKEVRHCVNIEVRSKEMKEKIADAKMIYHAPGTKRKELNKNEQRRRCSGADVPDVPGRN